MPSLETDYTPEINISNELEIIEAYYAFIKDHLPDDPAEYVEEKTRAIIQGVPTWIRRNLEDTQGAVYDYYLNGRHVGFIDVDEDNVVTAYMNSSVKTETADKIYDIEPRLPRRDLVLCVALVEQVAAIEAEQRR